MSIPKAEIPAFIAAEQVLVYNSIAAGTFILWDQCITFSQEVELIWKSKFGAINSLFFVIRYLTSAIRIAYFIFYVNPTQLIHPSTETCVKWLWFEALSGQILFLAVEILLIIRVFAFYERNRYLLVGILFAFLCETAAEFGIIGVTVPKITIIPTPLPAPLDARACVIVKIPGIFNNYWVPGLIFESMLFILVVVKFIKTKLSNKSIESPHFLVVFIRDGTWAFVLIFALLLWAALTFELSTQKGDIALTWIYSVLAFCGTRLTLNLRMAGRKELTISAPSQSGDLELRRIRLPFSNASSSGETSTRKTADFSYAY